MNIFLSLKSGSFWVRGSLPGFSSLLDETLNRGPMTIFQDKLLTITDCDNAGDYVVRLVPNGLSPRDLVFRPEADIGHKLYHHPIYCGRKAINQTNKTIQGVRKRCHF